MTVAKAEKTLGLGPFWTRCEIIICKIHGNMPKYMLKKNLCSSSTPSRSKVTFCVEKWPYVLHREVSNGARKRRASPAFYLTRKHPLGPYIHQLKVRRNVPKLTTTNSRTLYTPFLWRSIVDFLFEKGINTKTITNPFNIYFFGMKKTRKWCPLFKQ